MSEKTSYNYDFVTNRKSVDEVFGLFVKLQNNTLLLSLKWRVLARTLDRTSGGNNGHHDNILVL